LYQVSQVELLSLIVVNLVTYILVAVLVDVEDWEELSIVGDQGLSDHLSTDNKLLDDLQSDLDDIGVSGIKSGLKRDDKLWDDWQDL